MVQHPTTYLDNCSESLMSARGGDFVPRRPLHWSFHGLFEPPLVTDFLCCRDFSLEQPSGSSPFFSISGPVPKVTENGTFRAILL